MSIRVDALGGLDPNMYVGASKWRAIVALRRAGRLSVTMAVDAVESTYGRSAATAARLAIEFAAADSATFSSAVTSRVSRIDTV